MKYLTLAVLMLVCAGPLRAELTAEQRQRLLEQRERLVQEQKQEFDKLQAVAARQAATLAEQTKTELDLSAQVATLNAIITTLKRENFWNKWKFCIFGAVAGLFIALATFLFTKAGLFVAGVAAKVGITLAK